MAHKKGQGSTRNGRNSNPQYRGIKAYGGQRVRPGQIIVRQCGTKFHPGHNTRIGNDYTIFSVVEGRVHFGTRRRINVIPDEKAV